MMMIRPIIWGSRIASTIELTTPPTDLPLSIAAITSGTPTISSSHPRRRKRVRQYHVRRCAVTSASRRSRPAP